MRELLARGKTGVVVPDRPVSVHDIVGEAAANAGDVRRRTTVSTAPACTPAAVASEGTEGTSASSAATAAPDWSKRTPLDGACGIWLGLYQPG